MQIKELDDQRHKHLHRSGAPWKDGNMTIRLEQRAKRPGALLADAKPRKTLTGILQARQGPGELLLKWEYLKFWHVLRVIYRDRLQVFIDIYLMSTVPATIKSCYPRLNLNSRANCRRYW
uniref:Ribosomal protein S14 n=1 Tax=Romanomermis culicivorax TaxID=13658 RepID=A0A915HMW4_ROMCU